MPSPFPGMDPYLEDPTHWPGVHLTLIASMQAALNRVLRPRYMARAERRVYLLPEDDPGRKIIRVPDLRIERRPGRQKAARPTDGTAVLTEPLVVTTLLDDETREGRVEIVSTDTKAVVTVIELLSPTNKTAGSEGRRSFLEKRREVTTSGVHWVEVDLLRAGQPATGVRDQLPPHEYFVHVSPADLRPHGRVWPVRLADRLPEIGVPLRSPDPDARLDLQGVLDAAYEDGAFDLGIDYGGDPVPPLPPDLAAWADALLNEKGLR